VKVKVICLGRSAKEIDTETGATVEQAIKVAGFPEETSYNRQVNGHPAFDSDILQAGDILTLVPQVKGGR